MPEMLFSEQLKKKKRAITSMPCKLALKFVLGSQSKKKRGENRKPLGP